MTLRIEPVRVDNLHPAALRSVFWELGPDATVVDPEIEKELWLSRTLMTHGTCGFSALSFDTPSATVFFAPPTLLPGAATMPSRISADAVLISSLFADIFDPGTYAQLLDATLVHLLGQEVAAVEAFAWRSGPWGHLGLIPDFALEAAGFWEESAHDELPRYRIELPPSEGLMAVAEVEELLRVRC
ncbi:hypothetical protein QVA66_09740 [Staphylococcus chromogenes]|nr:hypothetical protein [Staphylococcus chromogenes]